MTTQESILLGQHQPDAAVETLFSAWTVYTEEPEHPPVPARERLTQPPLSLSAPPPPELIRDACPMCGEVLVSGLYYVAGRGYLILHECLGSLVDPPTCDFRRVL